MEETLKELQLGETKVYISDKYCKDVTPEQVEQILKNIVSKTIRYLQKKTA